jgi:parallel beta-helix repeat protein
MTPASSSRHRSALALAAVLGLTVAVVALLANAADAARPGALARVSYAGPRGPLHGSATLRADARGGAQGIVAVTFVVDGRPLATATSPPYGLRVDVDELPAGPHTLRVEAVDRLGRRSVSAPARVRVPADPPRALVASTPAMFEHARAALARGNVTVVLRPGRYSTQPLVLGSGARLRGAGPSTVLTPAFRGQQLLQVHGSDVRVSSLALDGLRRVDQVVGVDGSSQVRLSRLQIAGMRGNGVGISGPHHGVSVQDSSITGRGADGAGVLDLGSERSSDVSVIRCSIAGFRGWGIDFVQRRYGSATAARHNVALDNKIRAIQDPSIANGTREGGIWSGGVNARIVGNTIRNTGWDGIETVGSSTHVTITGNTISDTGVGIYLEHETNQSLIARNRISDVNTGINVEWRFNGAGSSDNSFTRNRIANASEAGLFVDVAEDRNRITRNVFSGGSGDAIVLQGSSDNVVTGNRTCGGGNGPVVRLQVARFDNGRPARSLRNSLTDNVGVASCAGL